MITGCNNCEHIEKRWCEEPCDKCIDGESGWEMATKHECCATCRNNYSLEKSDYSQSGCIDTQMEGFICMAFASEEIAVWMVGCNPNEEQCEMYSPKESKK